MGHGIDYMEWEKEIEECDEVPGEIYGSPEVLQKHVDGRKLWEEKWGTLRAWDLLKALDENVAEWHRVDPTLKQERA